MYKAAPRKVFCGAFVNLPIPYIKHLYDFSPNPRSLRQKLNQNAPQGLGPCGAQFLVQIFKLFNLVPVSDYYYLIPLLEHIRRAEIGNYLAAALNSDYIQTVIPTYL